MKHPFTRRTCIPILVVTALAMAGCASATASSTTTDDAASLTLQLRYITNVQFAGSYEAEQSAYADENLTVDLVPGGSGISVDPAIEQGTVDIGISSPSSTAEADAQGADLVIIAAGYQNASDVIVSLPGNPISSVADLKGKKLGAFSSRFDSVENILEANGLQEGDVTLVPITDDTSMLLSGQVDAIVSISTNAPITLEQQGITPVVLDADDLGINQLDFTYTVARSSLEDPVKRSAIVRFIRAEAAGWQAAIDDPEGATDLTLSLYGTANSLDADQQLAQMKAQIALFEPDGDPASLLQMSDDKIAETLETLEKLGVDADDSLFDTSVLQEALNG
ncbi:MAG: ABC transporter substrate-binding protein [Microbacterium sp.]